MRDARSSRGQCRRAEGITPLVGLLSASDEASRTPPGRMREQAVRAIHYLALDNTETQRSIVQQGATNPLIAMLAGDRTGDSLHHAVAALAELAKNPANADAIYQGGALPHLIAVLQEEDDQMAATKRFATSTLALLATAPEEQEAPEGTRVDRVSAERVLSATPDATKDGARAKAVDDSAAAAPQETAEGTTAHSRSASPVAYVATPATAAVTTAKGRRQRSTTGEVALDAATRPAAGMSRAEAVAAAGAIPPLVKLMRGECGLEAQKEAVRALYALADDEHNRSAIAEGGGIDPLMNILDSPDQAMRKHAEGTLARLSLVDSNQMLIIKQLVGMLEKDASGQEQAAACLANLACELPQSRDSIVEAGGIPRLLSLLISGSAKIKVRASDCYTWPICLPTIFQSPIHHRSAYQLLLIASKLHLLLAS